jgi:hypothetical protein
MFLPLLIQEEKVQVENRFLLWVTAHSVNVMSWGTAAQIGAVLNFY